jgi:hypothetical protein
MANPFATDDLRYSNTVKHEYAPELGWTRQVVTVNEAAAKDYKIGLVLGKVTASGKYKAAVETAVDGSKVGAAVVLEVLSVAAATDTKVLVMVRGPALVSKAGLIIDATYNDATKLAALYADLEAKLILANDAV